MPDHDNLREIKTFPTLVKYLRDELDWPIEADDFEDLTFDYEPEELGIDAKTAAKIEQIKQLRPLVAHQPWGIFFVKFEPKRLPVMALRRILSKLIITKRTSAKKSNQPSWLLHDLLFISNYGEGEQRQITFAHFSQDEEMGDLPTLKVLGWDDADTALHIDHAHQELKEKLHWQEDDEKISDWRLRWSSLFTLRHKEVITTSKALSERLAILAADIRKRVNTILRLETEKGPIRKLQTDFRTALIHDLSDDDFADMYAQTITYGLLTARVSRPAGLVAENVTDMVPVTNPFLRDLMSTFLTIGGRKGKVDFDEVGINDVVQTLRDANMEAVLRDFGDRKPEEDPVIFFYEDFLKAYDKKKKVQRGVFYTPKPVVSYIVRSVHELLQKEFGLEDGLADTTTWVEMVKKFPPQEEETPGLQIPAGTSPDTPFVQILDPATGTGTFLVEVIEVIFRTLTSKWKQQGLTKERQRVAWNDYVPKHLLPRLHGYELMMAPYAIAHMKIGLKLYETGYRFGSDERARIYLTNALEPPSDVGQLRVFSEALAHEAQSVNTIKRDKRFTVIIGNPPYSYESSNSGEFISSLMQRYYSIKGSRLLEKNPRGIQDDYVKFFRLGEHILKQTHAGVLGYVTNHGYLDNPTFRGMRYALITSSKKVFVFDLHGNIKKIGFHSHSIEDENVFDIQQGVAIGLFLFWNDCEKREHLTLDHSQIIGSRLEKYNYLSQKSFLTTEWKEARAIPDFYLLFPQDTRYKEEYENNYKICDVFKTYSVGIQTGRDALTIGWSKGELNRTLSEFVSLSPEKAREVFQLGEDSRDWKVSLAQDDLKRTALHLKKLVPISYRPFDTRFTYYTGRAKGIHMNPRSEVMNNLLGETNIALYTCRQISVASWTHAFACRFISDDCYISNKTSERGYAYPLYLIPNSDELTFDRDKKPNFTLNFLKELAIHLCLEQNKPHNLPQGLTPEDIFHYIYAVFHSPGYRSRYAEFMKIDFPRLPLAGKLELFRALSQLGGELVALHLMESSKLDNHITKWLGETPSGEIAKVTYSDETVWISKAMSEGFQGIPGNVWNFHIGGYQVCQKWLKDRKGRQLSKVDIEHYQKIVVALNETIRLMAEIDDVINAHGGWPDAFQTSGGVESTTYETEPFEYLKAAEDQTKFGEGQKKQQ